jgi:hypothetical protein
LAALQKPRLLPKFHSIDFWPDNQAVSPSLNCQAHVQTLQTSKRHVPSRA